MDVERPIFIGGTGRCGSTIFYEVFAHHPSVTWLSLMSDKFPDHPQFHHWLIQLVDLPWLGRYIQRVGGPRESYAFWENYCPGFSEPCRDLHRDDLSSKSRSAIYQAMQGILTPKRSRLLIKLTGWPRIDFIRTIFPDAKFIHVYRDGRAVVNSLLSVSWWRGWHGPEGWRWGGLSERQREAWGKYNQSFVILAAIEWEILMAAQEKARQQIPADDYLAISYEALCQNPVQVFRQATEFSGLDWSARFQAMIEKTQLRNTNDKWRTHLSKVQQKMLNEYLQETLEKYGYS